MATLDEIKKSLENESNYSVKPPEGVSGQQRPSFDAAVSPNKSFSEELESSANSPGVNAVLGAGDAVRNLLSLGTLSGNKSGEGTAYDIGKMAGDVGSFVGGGELLDLGRLGLEGVQGIGKAAQFLGKEGLPSALKRMMGSSAYGAAENAEDRGQGALEGGIGGAVAEGLPYLKKPLGAIADFANPGKYARRIAENLKESFKEVKQDFEKRYAPTIGKFGNYRLGTKNNNYSAIPERVKERFFSGSTRADEDFLKRPTIGNAHKLQSELGFEIRKLESKEARGQLTADDNTSLKSLRSARKAIQADMKDFFILRSPNLAQSYKDVTKEYLQEAAPYKQTPTIAKMSHGKLKNPTPSQILTQFEESEFPKFKDLARSLHLRMGANKAAKIAGGAGLGALSGSAFGPIGAGIGALMGGGVPAAAGHFGASVSPALLQSLSKLLGKSYRPAAKAAQAITMGGR